MSVVGYLEYAFCVCGNYCSFAIAYGILNATELSCIFPLLHTGVLQTYTVRAYPLCILLATIEVLHTREFAAYKDLGALV